MNPYKDFDLDIMTVTTSKSSRANSDTYSEMCSGGSGSDNCGSSIITDITDMIEDTTSFDCPTAGCATGDCIQTVDYCESMEGRC